MQNDAAEFDGSAGSPSAISSTAHRAKAMQKRDQTKGELVFNFGVYGGISWIVNEILSTIITKTIYFADPAEKAARAKQIAEQATRQLEKGEKLVKPLSDGRFARAFNNTVNWLHTKANPFKWGKTPFYLASEMFVMCIGGTLLVAPTKWIEDRKGKIVRSLDQFFHGGKEDAKLEAAHKEMDEAPQQSWGSLWRGRLVVLASAIGLHFFAGAENTKPPHGTTGVEPYTAPTTRWLKGTIFEKYSNLSRIMKTGTRDLFSQPWMPFISKEHKAAMRTARAAEGVPVMTMAEGKIAHAMGNTFGYVLSVSAAMATIFYVSSRIFAAIRDNKNEQKNTTQSLDSGTANQSADIKNSETTLDMQRKKDQPDTTVYNIRQFSPLQPNAGASLIA